MNARQNILSASAKRNLQMLKPSQPVVRADRLASAVKPVAFAAVAAVVRAARPDLIPR